MPSSALILVAAGIGQRAGGDIPKQYQRVAGKPLIAHTLENLTNAMKFDQTRVVVSANDIWIDDIIADLGLSNVTTQGGATRTDSVRAGLAALPKFGLDHVYIHDAARPFVNSALFLPLQDALKTHQGAAPALPIADALKTKTGDAVDRETLIRVQTPQAFDYAAISKAFAETPGHHADDIAVAKAAGLSLTFTAGQERNFKVTYPADFAKAEQMLETQTYIATGSGFDVHQFTEGDVLWLCGVPIKCGYTLKGHSDADAGLHALTDAILGALSAGDIGDHFPPEDPQWKGAESSKFVKFARFMVNERGGRLQHIDLTLICEKPKIKPHREAMRERIAELLELPLSRVSVKATTTEKLGFTGRGEGLAAQATVTIKLPDQDTDTEASL